MSVVDPLTADHRTASVGGERASVRQLAKMSQTLFAQLRADEVVSWAMTGLGKEPCIAVITNDRLLLLPIAAGDIRSVAAPYLVQMGKKRIMGQTVDVANRKGESVSLLLPVPGDVSKLRSISVTPGPSASREPPPDPTGPQASGPAPADRPGGAAGSLGAWRWNRFVATWQDAEQLAADHMIFLGFTGVVVTPAGSDAGLDVVAVTAGAQVKWHAKPTGAPDVQRLVGAAHGFEKRLFYATGYTAAAVKTADVLGIALFQCTNDGSVVPINAPARALTSRHNARAPKRNAFGRLDFESRQLRALEWAQQIQDAAEQPISNWKRKGARQLAAREQALQLLVDGLRLLDDTNNPLYKRVRKERTLGEAEKALKSAGLLLRLPLR